MVLIARSLLGDYQVDPTWFRVALNSVLNGRIARESGFEQVRESGLELVGERLRTGEKAASNQWESGFEHVRERLRAGGEAASNHGRAASNR